MAFDCVCGVTISVEFLLQFTIYWGSRLAPLYFGHALQINYLLIGSQKVLFFCFSKKAKTSLR